MNPSIDEYLKDGCGRCSLVGTPECKVNTWRAVIIELRKLALSTDLTEEMKWSVPCYTDDGNNILMIGAFKDYGFMSFFKGSLLGDPKKLLVAPGPNSQSTKMLRFTDVSEVIELEPIIRQYIAEAIQNERSGKKVAFRKVTDEDHPEELTAKFEEDPAFEDAFRSLTPGRQRGWLLHFNGAKQSQTKVNRIEKSMEKVFDGKGWNER